MKDVKVNFNAGKLVSNFSTIFDDFHQLQNKWEEDKIPKEMIFQMIMIFSADIAIEIHSKEEAMHIFYRILEDYDRNYC